jgi:hypothetical protein
MATQIGATTTAISQSKLVHGARVHGFESGSIALFFLQTVQQIKRFFKILAGFTLLLLGAIMLVTPGPGWLAIAFGLALLAGQYVWARRLLNRLKTQGERIRDTFLPNQSAKS